MSSPGHNPLDQRAQELIDRISGMTSDDRNRYLDQHCYGDQPLRERVDALLAAEERATEERRRSYASAPTLDPATAVAPQAKPATSGLSTKPPPQQIGPYKCLEVIGEGGFGTVWIADQISPVRRRVALKIIKPGMDSKAVIARFEQERQALAIMDHPNIAKVLDAGTSPDGRPYFVMEYVAGESITTYCDRNRLDIAHRLDLFMSVCDAVQHAHHKGIIHRDIKPTNVLVTVASGNPSVKVIDFGVAKAMSHHLTDKTLFTEQGQILGTPEYMSPEQAEMGALDIDTRTDVYSLGVLLYELLTGALPFEPHDLRSRGYNEIQRIIREVDPPRPSVRLRSLGKVSAEIAQKRHVRLEELTGQLRRELEWIPLKAMRKNRNERYATPIALADDIRNHLAGRPLVAGPETVAYRAKKFFYRNRYAVTAVGLVMLALLIGAIVSTIGFVRAAHNARIARQNEQTALKEAARANAEAARQQQINLFTTTLLLQANPASGERKDVTVRELLEDAVVKLEGGGLAGQPAIEAAVRRALALSFRSLNFFPAAEAQWRKAVELETSAFGDNSPEVAKMLAGLGQVLVEQGRLDEAEPVVRQALAIQRDSLEPNNMEIGLSNMILGSLSDARGDYQAAQSRYRDALEIFQQHPGQTERITDAMLMLGGSQYKLGDYRQAIDTTRRALEMRQQRGGSRSDLWHGLSNLASMQEAADDFAAAEQTRREALSLARDLFDEKHRNTVISMSNLARTLWLRDTTETLEQAYTLQSQTLELAKSLEGEQSVAVAREMSLLGGIERDRGKLEQAIELFRKELALRRITQGSEHVETAGAMSLLADALTRAGKDPQEAIDLASGALEIRRKAYKADHWLVWSTTSVLGGAHSAAGQFETADPLLLSAYRGLEGGSSIGRRAAREAATRLVTHYEKWGKLEEAEKWRRTLVGLTGPTSKP